MRFGPVAQLGERLAGSQEVRGSSPLRSTSPAGFIGAQISEFLRWYVPCLPQNCPTILDIIETGTHGTSVECYTTLVQVVETAPQGVLARDSRATHRRKRRYESLPASRRDRVGSSFLNLTCGKLFVDPWTGVVKTLDSI